MENKIVPITAFRAMSLAVSRCEFPHQIETLIDMYLCTEFTKQEKTYLLLYFYRHIDRVCKEKDYDYICSLKLKVIQ